MGKEALNQVQPAHIEAWLRGRYGADARILALVPLGATTQEGLKAYGYGRPLRIVFRRGADAPDENLVLRTMSPDPFGHDRRSDRIASLVEAADDFPHIPRHIQPVAVGTFDVAAGREGTLVELAAGEPWLITTWVEGELYAHDLATAARAKVATASDRARATALARWLAELHAEARPPEDHRRDIRDTIGSGEGIFGMCDAWPDDHRLVGRLCALEQMAVAWRWRLRSMNRRARRTHGDFHPFNILFRSDDDFSVLDCSRRGAGEPADDVACLAINFLFFALVNGGAGERRFDGPMRTLWDDFWSTYLASSGDTGITSVVAPFFAWRALVVASPVWYPNVSEDVRDIIIGFAERLLAGAIFDPQAPEALLVGLP